ncbi:MAG: hypothetical protein ACE5JX_00850 [Acidobacteriota bacterium]
MMKKTTHRLVVLTVCSLGWVQAQNPGPDPLRRFLFPPELIMRHQQALELSDQQREYIVGQIQEAQSQFTSLQWSLEKEVQGMAAILETSAVPEAQVLSQLDKILDLERQIKRTHLLLGVRIRNQLTSEQLTRLKRMRNRNRDARPGVRSRPRNERPLQQPESSPPSGRLQSQDHPN